MMQPTLGLGAERPRASSPSATAFAIHSLSSVNPELLRELLILLLVGLLLRFLRSLVLLLVGGDLRVGAVGRVELDLDHLRRRRGVDLRIDEELDHDDRGDEQSERGTDHLLAAALAHEGEQVAKRRARTRG